MKPFTFYNPTRIEFGKGKENNIGRYISESGITRVLVVFGSDRIKTSGLYGRVTESLAANGISYESLGGIRSNPVLGKVYEGIEIAKAGNIEAVLAVGGGSVLDTSKTIAAGAVYEGDVWDFFTGRAIARKALKVFDIMTIAATGSEMNSYAVVTRDDTRQKFSFGSPAVFPVVSVINPELQATVTSKYLAYSAADIFAHSLDMYLSASYLPEYIAGYVENILKTVIRTTETLLGNPDNYEARGEFAWAATQALNLTTFCGVENNRFDTHFIEHTLSAEYDIAHGAGLSIVVPAWMKWQKNNLPGRFEQLARNLFNAGDADAGIRALIQWYTKIGTPVTLAEGNIPESDIPSLVEKLLNVARLQKNEKLYTREMITAVLENAR